MSFFNRAFALGTTASAAVSLFLVTACTLPTASPGSGTHIPDPGHDTPIPPGTGDDTADSGPDSQDSGAGLYQNFECGVGPVVGNASGGEYVSDADVVTFDGIPVGAKVAYSIPVQDSADVDETITGATLTGPGAGAFDVDSSFPIAVPAGQQVFVTVSFLPPARGTFSATLVLQTANMGLSPVELSGTAK